MHIRIEGHEERLLAIFARLLATRGIKAAFTTDNLAPGVPCDFVDSTSDAEHFLFSWGIMLDVHNWTAFDQKGGLASMLQNSLRE
jgi:hypothetical protein